MNYRNKLAVINNRSFYFPSLLFGWTDLGAWYVNLFRHARRKCVIVTNERTLYTVVIAGVVKRDMQQFPDLLRHHLGQQLYRDGIPTAVIDSLFEGYDEVAYAKTENRRVLGSMNDFVHSFEVHVKYNGGFGLCDLAQISSHLNRIPMKTIDYAFPIERLKAALGLEESS